MLNVHLYLAQRISAVIMAPLVLAHIAVMIYAVQDGLSAEEILGRTQGSLAWGVFYGLFVAAASVHAAIGLRVVIHETFALRGVVLELLTWVLGLGLAALGTRAVVAVVA